MVIAEVVEFLKEVLVATKEVLGSTLIVCVLDVLWSLKEDLGFVFRMSDEI